MLVEQRLLLRRPLLVASLGPSDVILEATEIRLGAIVGLLQTRVPLRERLVLLEQRLPVHRPLQLGILQLVELLLLFPELTLDQRQLLLFLRELRAHVILERLQVRDELLVLLQDVSEGFRFGGLLAHQAAFRPCCM